MSYIGNVNNSITAVAVTVNDKYNYQILLNLDENKLLRGIIIYGVFI